MAKTPSHYGSTKQAEALSDNPRPDPVVVEDFHTNDDLDARAESHHHSLGSTGTQASPGDHNHRDGVSQPILIGFTISGSRGGNTSLPSIIAALVALGATDASTP